VRPTLRALFVLRVSQVHVGLNKEREVFGACVVERETGTVLSIAVNEVVRSRDATCTSEVLAIQRAAQKKGTYVE
jgi:tRNA(Arg) A34 adenosine deaminase TadA